MNLSPQQFSVPGKMVTEADYDPSTNRTTFTVVAQERSPQGTTIYDLIERQGDLQRMARHYGQREHREGELRLAYLAELGEFIQELKPSWAWWRKLNDRTMIDEQKAVGELADLLHFVLIEALGDTEIDLKAPLTQYMWSSEADLPLRRPEIEASALGDSESELETLPLDEFLLKADRFMAAIDMDLEDLIDAYFVKADENEKRWQTTAQQTKAPSRSSVFIRTASGEHKFLGTCNDADLAANPERVVQDLLSSRHAQETPDHLYDQIDGAIAHMIQDPTLEDLLSTPVPPKTPMEVISEQLGFRY